MQKSAHLFAIMVAFPNQFAGRDNPGDGISAIWEFAPGSGGLKPVTQDPAQFNCSAILGNSHEIVSVEGAIVYFKDCALFSLAEWRQEWGDAGAFLVIDIGKPVALLCGPAFVKADRPLTEAECLAILRPIPTTPAILGIARKMASTAIIITPL